jgi:hypothetical protein
MERMGHSSTRAALIYLHAASDGHERIAEGIDRKMTPTRATAVRTKTIRRDVLG